MTSTVTSDLTSALATSQLQIPTLLQRASEFPSVCNEPEAQTLASNRYDEINWTRLKGYQVPIDDFTPRGAGIYDHGWRLWKVEEDEYCWYCRRCQKTSRKPVLMKVS